MNILQDFNRVIYTLQRKFGTNIALYRTTETSDFTTGIKQVQRTKINIKKAILLPSAAFRDYNYASLLPGTMTSQYGGIIDTTVRRVILNRKKLPKGYILTVNDYCIIKHNRYSVKEITEMEEVFFYSFILKQVKGQPSFEIHEQFIDEFLELDEKINGDDVIDEEERIEERIEDFIQRKKIVDYPYNPFLIYENLEDMEEMQGPG